MQSVGPRRTAEAPRFIGETTWLSHAQGLQYLATLQREQSDVFKNNNNKQMISCLQFGHPFISPTHGSQVPMLHHSPLKTSVLISLVVQ